MSTNAHKNRSCGIVIVDDDREMRSLLHDFLSACGYQIETFSSATDALEAFDSLTDVELIISDIKMPQMNGFEFAEQIKGLRPQLPVVLTSAFGGIESATEAIRCGVYAYVAKPFRLAELQVIVEHAIESARLRHGNPTAAQSATQIVNSHQ